MLKALYDRIVYALIGLVLGAVFATILWLLYDIGFSRQPGHPQISAGFINWIKYVGGTFALIGFFFKDRVGSALGRSSNEVYEYESGGYNVPTWLLVVVLVIVALVVWHFARQP